MNNALNIAKYVIKKCSDDGKMINNLKLQKILFFIQVFYYIAFSEWAFEDEIEAWDYGVVVRQVYLKYCSNGCFNIKSVKEEPILHIDEEKKTALNMIIERFVDFSASELIEITRKEGSPWKKCYKRGRKELIPRDEIKKYCKALSKTTTALSDIIV